MQHNQLTIGEGGEFLGELQDKVRMIITRIKLELL